MTGPKKSDPVPGIGSEKPAPRRRKKKGPGRGHYPRTPAQIRALRTNGFVHGKRARSVGIEEAVTVKVARLTGREDLIEIQKAIAAGFAGDLSGMEALAAQGMAQGEVIRRQLFEDVQERGAMVTETVTDADGKTIADRVKVHPGIEQFRKLNEAAGMTAEAQRLTPKSKGEGDAANMTARILAADLYLRGLRPTGAAALDVSPEPEGFVPNRKALPK